jgi:hypothetical protein
LAITPGICLEIKIGDDGAWNPGPTHQRYRANEFPEDKPFFQWWYFSLKDYATGMTFAFDYSLSRPATNQTYRGCYVMAALVNSTSRFHVYYKYPLDSLSIANDFDYSVDNQTLTDEGNGHYHAKGKMNNASKVWISEGISPNSNVEWDLDVFRVAGWYGQNDIEDLIKLSGVISWNTYAYDSEVNGSIWINSTRYDITRGPRFRIYCDMNWGETFPHGDPAIDHMWGWFYTGQPAADPSDDFSLIAGIGRSDTTIGFGNPFHGKFASLDIHGRRIGAREGRIFDQPQNSGLLIFQRATDGNCHVFRVDRADWISFSDAFGTAQIPLTQIVTIETESIRVVMTFHSTAANYNRLLFPTDGYIFSDFEGLGVNCTTQVFERSFASIDWLKTVPVYTLSETVVDHNAGIEYGYKISTAI